MADEPNKGGRPQIEIDAKLVQELANAQLTTAEIAKICGCSKDTIERRFAASLKEWKDEGVGSVRRRLYQSALGQIKGASQTTALIFFLKNYGGLADVTRDEQRKPLDFGDLPTPTSQPGTTGKPN
ncbi:MAG TPA: hypothetical protein VHV32_19295 [Candidatus Angelobacter sp.]|jgi:hypothetical protein|nr:hypothetical protein [Candidatus Angelobacter sp.]